MQSNKKSFKGQKIFIGIDVHAKTWAVETLTESGFTKRHAQEASAKPSRALQSVMPRKPLQKCSLIF